MGENIPVAALSQVKSRRKRSRQQLDEDNNVKESESTTIVPSTSVDVEPIESTRSDDPGEEISNIDEQLIEHEELYLLQHVLRVDDEANETVVGLWDDLQAMLYSENFFPGLSDKDIVEQLNELCKLHNWAKMLGDSLISLCNMKGEIETRILLTLI